MKIRLSYLPCEDTAASMIVRLLCALVPAFRVQRSDKHPPRHQYYLSTRHDLQQVPTGLEGRPPRS